MSGTETLRRLSIKDIWINAWGELAFRYHTLSVVIGACIIAFIVPDFFIYIDSRTGTLLNDPIIHLIPAQDVSAYTFLTLNSAILLATIYLIPYPKALIKCLQAYCLVTLMRFSAILLFPLEPPIGIIPLVDPFIAYFFADGKPVFKDLFFSGHTCTMYLLFMTAQKPWLKRLLLAGTILMGILVVVQHVHYTIDVLGAPFFVWLSYRLVERVNSLSDAPDQISG
ncbi:MAG: phosphatase PAP2-related protein [Bacteroidota bacterium]